MERKGKARASIEFCLPEQLALQEVQVIGLERSKCLFCMPFTKRALRVTCKLFVALRQLHYLKGMCAPQFLRKC
jgi:hypothetical protein